MERRGCAARLPDAIGLRECTAIHPNCSELERVADRVRLAGFAAAPMAGGVLVRVPYLNGVALVAGSGPVGVPDKFVVRTKLDEQQELL